jgi:hypothetical protein
MTFGNGIKMKLIGAMSFEIPSSRRVSVRKTLMRKTKKIGLYEKDNEIFAKRIVCLLNNCDVAWRMETSEEPL